MKRVVYSALTAVCFISLAACGHSGVSRKAAKPASAPPTAAAEATPELTVVPDAVSDDTADTAKAADAVASGAVPPNGIVASSGGVMEAVLTTDTGWYGSPDGQDHNGSGKHAHVPATPQHPPVYNITSATSSIGSPQDDEPDITHAVLSESESRSGKPRVTHHDGTMHDKHLLGDPIVSDDHAGSTTAGSADSPKPTHGILLPKPSHHDVVLGGGGSHGSDAPEHNWIDTKYPVPGTGNWFNEPDTGATTGNGNPVIDAIVRDLPPLDPPEAQPTDADLLAVLIPEPTAAGLLAVGLIGFTFVASRRRTRAAR